MPTVKERFQGSLMGLAVGDALGHPVESKLPGTFAPITDMEVSPHFGQAGLFTDDASQALCLAHSMLEYGKFNPKHALETLLSWYEDGLYSSVGRSFGTGGGTRRAMERFKQTGELYDIDTPGARGNGCIMRIAPVAMFHYNFHTLGIPYIAGESALITHGDSDAREAAAYAAIIIHQYLHGADKEAGLDPKYFLNDNPSPVIKSLLEGEYKTLNPPRIKGDRYAVGSLEAALWVHHTTDSFEEGVLKAVNLGHDTDTTAAVYGQIAGAYYGINAIPERWINKLIMSDVVLDMANKLYGKVIEMNTEGVARRIVEEVFTEFSNRCGFGSIIDELDDDINEEIQVSLFNRIKEVLDKNSEKCLH